MGFEGTIELHGVRKHCISSVGFILDCSGSMAGRPFELAKLALTEAILGLDPAQKFIIVAACDFSCSKGSVQATAYEKVKALTWLYALAAGGGTDMPRAHNAMQSYHPDVVFVFTDGEYTRCQPPERIYEVKFQRDGTINRAVPVSRV